MHIRHLLNIPILNQKIIKFAEKMGCYGLKDKDLKKFMPYEID